MLIPSIDLMGNRIVQLRRGEELMLETADVDGWIAKLARFPIVQLIDLDAAMRRGSNDALVERLVRALPCQVGGGIRRVERARALLASGARRVILGSVLFDDQGVRTGVAQQFAEAVGSEALVGAVDGRGGRVLIHGWKTPLAIAPHDAARALDPFVGALLYTNVEIEGTLAGFSLDTVHPILASTRRRLIVAGGIRSRDEIDALDALGVDAVVGMAIYTGIIDIAAQP
jgi:phosphoribosylformimino-5-aminoimidazole carboxamide ribotide isomerase